MANIIPSQKLYDDTIQDYQDRKANPDKYAGIKLSIPWLDNRVRIRRGWVHWFYGQAGMGKTTLVVMSAIAAGQATIAGGQAFRGVYFTFEDSLFETAHRIISNVAHVSRVGLRDAVLDQAAENRMYAEDQGASLKKFDLFWIEDAYTQADMEQAIAVIQPHWVFIDGGLHLINYPGMNNNESVTAAVKFCVRLGEGYYTNGEKVGVVGSVQLNDDNKTLWSRDPQRAADLAIAIEDIPDGTGRPVVGQKRIRIDKWRHGSGQGDFTDLLFFGDENRLAEKSPLGSIPHPPAP